MTIKKLLTYSLMLELRWVQNEVNMNVIIALLIGLAGSCIDLSLNTSYSFTEGVHTKLVLFLFMYYLKY